jgi:hypothetical protein
MAVDLVTTRLMGFDPRKLRQFDLAFDPAWDFGFHPYSDLEVRCGDQSISGGKFFAPENKDPLFGFVPHPGWKGHLEV